MKDSDCYVSSDRRPRPKLTTPQEDENIRRAVQDDPFTNAVAIRESLHLNVTPQTIRNRLHDTTEGTYMKSVEVVTSRSTSGGGCVSMAWVT
ncbi:hypothetical protein Pcinc_005994 [Petrolisthes cinctipes]|uniref:Transposase Tc1-like domain-containing protein n=1 Tax=Petrolisthes cinctipes TaxID=88211 RepID=A0AAE1GBI9_PETCI|nr:hypothetical protein Pcinc_005994 [Petrolisthes cinctipes]